MNKAAFCIVLYNKSISQCDTLKHLLKYSDISLNKYEILVFNNGPYLVDCVAGPNLAVHQVLVNASLARLYNKFIEMTSADCYVFLDDDTALTAEYIEEVLCGGYNILIPKINCNGNSYYPVHLRSGIQSITSGVVLSNKYVRDSIRERGKVFDERFDLYGIDTALFYSINKNKSAYTIADSVIEHDLSHITADSNDFRCREVLLSNSAALVKYFSLKLLAQCLLGILRAIVRLDFKLVYRALNSFFSMKVVR